MSAARVYDCLLGGSTNFRPDREAADELQRALPTVQGDAWANRSFLGRAVAYLLDQGVTQFLDLGSGLPTVGNVHEIAQARDPGARVVYVDCDSVAATHSQSLLGSVDGVAVLHFIARCDDPVSILSAYAEALVPGSHLVISHATGHTLDRDQATAAAAVYEDTATPLMLRTPMQVADLFAGFSLLPPSDGAVPGVVAVSEWRPDPLEQDVATRTVYGGVGVLPAPDGSADGASSVRGAAPRMTPPTTTAPFAAGGVRLK